MCDAMSYFSIQINFIQRQMIQKIQTKNAKFDSISILWEQMASQLMVKAQSFKDTGM